MAELIKNVLETIIKSDKNWKTDLLYKWRDIIGSLHNKVCIEKIYDDTIILGVLHSSLMQELYLLTPLLINTINKSLDQPRIKQVRFKQAGIKKNRPPLAKAVINKKKFKEITLTQEDERILEKVTDSTLRETLRAFRMRCYREMM